MENSGPLQSGNSSVVEHNLAKVGVASSNLVSRSNLLQSWQDCVSLMARPGHMIRIKPIGWVAEWLCSGLQSRGRRFDSDPSLHIPVVQRMTEKPALCGLFAVAGAW